MKSKNNYIPKTLTKSNLLIKRFPKKYRDDVNKFYVFMSATGSLVNTEDGVNNLKYLVRRWQGIKKEDIAGSYKRLDDSINEFVLADIVYLARRFELDSKDIDDYFRSLAIHARNKQLHSPNELARYLQYSAESPALMLTKVLGLPNALAHHAKMQSRALKILHMTLFIGNESKQNLLFPQSELKKYNLKSLKKVDIEKNISGFSEFVALQVKRYRAWSEEAKKGDEFLPKKLKPVIKLNRASYDLIASAIEKNPLVLFEAGFKKPSRIRVRVKVLLKK